MNSNPWLAPFIDDGIGHTLLTATPLPLIGTARQLQPREGRHRAVQFLIPPARPARPITNPIIWSFSTDGGLLSLSVIAGRESITPGIADPGPTLDASLEILNTSGSVLYLERHQQPE